MAVLISFIRYTVELEIVAELGTYRERLMPNAMHGILT